ncbi:MAG: hypothetical protein U0838_00650 [Chloroflexota bacterium]
MLADLGEHRRRDMQAPQAEHRGVGERDPAALGAAEEVLEEDVGVHDDGE